VYSMFAIQTLDLHRYTEKMWEKLEAAVQPPTGDMFALPAPAPVNPAGAPGDSSSSNQSNDVTSSSPPRRSRASLLA